MMKSIYELCSNKLRRSNCYVLSCNFKEKQMLQVRNAISDNLS